ncbi:hypothetical protein VD0002_g9149 [Verticillium dahliae]|uniref:GYF domain-containing protein n=1 Tax=Verticillium dahliae TaxID=27337 RepID=A0A2J8EM08_VERDA|nr:Casein kinase II subunit beta-1 [Verticillium dahliae VDG2]KAH6702448.1 hypothetical protein EV126DRAFT_418256 [Verticillium dahliae]PNH36704.1 hypothetical protein BJF96_g227 [Verticillium dahliae]PNH39088.1 hypothetical protein VD0004_g7795 [Verticillium dahliae]PNH44402.1 hypothetical protein VD0003_g9436 [Verticillium dahliae]
MASRHTAARPKRAGEDFARTHHHDTADPDSKKVKFDVRNPSALAADAREEDAVLEADVIGGGAATKRGAVNLDGYDSDSDGETFNTRADKRALGKGEANILEQLDNYDSKSAGGGSKGGKASAADDDDDDDDMFAEPEDAPKEAAGAPESTVEAKKKAKAVHFLQDTDIEGQDMQSKSGGQIRLDDEDSDDDEETRDMAMQEEGIDEEVGLGGLKRNAPKVEAFNMKDEQEEGRFDADGNFIRKAVDPDAQHDKWLDGVSKKEMKKAAEAHERREAEARRLRMENDSLLTTDILKSLILKLDKGETPLEALARLGKGQAKQKKIPKWKLKKQKGGAEGMDVDQAEKAEDPEQKRIREAIAAITDAADKLLSRDRAEIYDEEREVLLREWQRETGEDWVEPTQEADSQEGKMWEFRWVDGRDDADKQGPFDSQTMKAWQDAGYFGEGVEFRPAGDENEWSRVAGFA